MQDSELDLVVAGTEGAVLMVESEANMLSEDVMLDAVMYGHDQMQSAIKAINELAAEVNATPWDWQAPPVDEALKSAVESQAKAGLEAAYNIAEKQSRYEAVGTCRDATIDALVASEDDAGGYSREDVSGAFSSLEKSIVRGRVIAGEKRIDGRDTSTVRPISVQAGVLPRTHGSAVFTRGETQAIVTATLGTTRDAQIIDGLIGETRMPFMLHYNFPPYCVGETGFVGTPKRREIGHGKLAKRGVQAVMPDDDVFPYVIRIVSEITESNGSSSMASVCGATLGLMDAGVPITNPVAGISVGLVKKDDDWVLLTDILGTEDHFGDMDFKLCGTKDGVTGFQLDLKLAGVPLNILQEAVTRATKTRHEILAYMNEVQAQPKAELSPYAPRIEVITINPDKIGALIGPGGKNVKGIRTETGAEIDINDDGTVKIYCNNGEGMSRAVELIEQITGEIEVGKVYRGKVVSTKDFGAFVEVFPGSEGLVHISELSETRVEKTEDVVKRGEECWVKCIGIDDKGRVKLSRKAALKDMEAQKEAQPQEA